MKCFVPKYFLRKTIGQLFTLSLLSYIHFNFMGADFCLKITVNHNLSEIGGKL